MRGDVGVHAAHCCPYCGCKYGDESCPVVAKIVAVAYICEDCENNPMVTIHRAYVPLEKLQTQVVEALAKENTVVKLTSLGITKLDKVIEILEQYKTFVEVVAGELKEHFRREED